MDLLLAILGGEFSELYFHRLAFLSDSGRLREVLKNHGLLSKVGYRTMASIISVT
jgi:hypothetical protein